MEDNSGPIITEDGHGLGSHMTLQVPRGLKGLQPLRFNMTSVYRVISRIEEIQRVTPATFPELITDFNMGMVELNRIVGLIEIELKEAENTLDMAESIALLERVDPFLKSRNIASSADTRKAAKIIDPDVQSAIRTKDAVQAILTYTVGLKASLERAYFSAKHVADMVGKDPYLNRTGGDYNGR